MGLGHDNKALAWFKEAVHLRFDHVNSHLAMARLYQKGGFLREAIESFKHVLRVRDDFASGHYEIALIYLKLDKPAEARRHYALLRKLDAAMAKKLAPRFN